MVYGDTDSIMINTGVKDYGECIRIGEGLKKEINKRYTYLQIDVDYVFKRMLLLKKKKYAALKVVSVVNGAVNAQREVKGIDLVRRDWSVITKTAGNQLLNLLFSDISRDDFRIKIGEYLTQLAENMKEGKIPLEQFVITKSLTHALREYDSKNNSNNPHVVVALRMQKSGQIMNISYCPNCAPPSPSRRRLHSLRDLRLHRPQPPASLQDAGRPRLQHPRDPLLPGRAQGSMVVVRVTVARPRLVPAQPAAAHAVASGGAAGGRAALVPVQLSGLGVPGHDGGGVHDGGRGLRLSVRATREANGLRGAVRAGGPDSDSLWRLREGVFVRWRAADEARGERGDELCGE